MSNDFCILCGKEALTIDDLCSDCHMKNFWESLEPARFNYGDYVKVIKDDPNKGKIGLVVPPHRLARKADYWIELVSDIDGAKYYAPYERKDLELHKAKN